MIVELTVQECPFSVLCKSKTVSWFLHKLNKPYLLFNILSFMTRSMSNNYNLLSWWPSDSPSVVT